jgi:hypothetical protein
MPINQVSEVIYEPIDPRLQMCREITNSPDDQHSSQRHIDKLNLLINSDPAFERNPKMFQEMLKALGSRNLIMPKLIEFHTVDGYWICDFDFRSNQLVFFFITSEDPDTLQSLTSFKDLAFQLHQDLQRNGNVEMRLVFPGASQPELESEPVIEVEP